MKNNKVDCKTLENNIKERLKYWHINCINCGCKVMEFLKDGKQFIDLVECQDCKNKIKIYHKQQLDEMNVLSQNKNNQTVIINCNFVVAICPTCRSKK